MGALAGFRYRDIVRRLKALGLEFHRQAAGSHEIWFNPALNRYTTIPNHPGDMPEGTLRAILKQAVSMSRLSCRRSDTRCGNGVLAEQFRSVARVDALMPLCGQLEASLNAASETRRRLFEAILVEALSPEVKRELETTE